MRIFCGPDTETRFEEVAISFRRVDAAPPAPPMHVSAPTQVTRTTIVAFEPRWGAHDLESRTWHPAPFEQMVVIRPEVQHVIDRLANVPVDIAPKFVTAAELTKQ